MIYVPNCSTTNNSSVSARDSLSARNHSTSRYNNFSKTSSSFQSIKAIRLLIICAAMLVSFLTGIIVHAVSGTDEVQAASLHSAASSQLNSTSSVQSVTDPSSKHNIIVLEGDTLWSIAELHAPKGQDIRAYIQKLKRTNQLSSSALQAGDVLVLP
ncbi:MAG: hypothetical protein K0Q81_1014 [Paenibacillus sp.]|nr:hypothetical protein [Paenibacillus sp.]